MHPKFCKRNTALVKLRWRERYAQDAPFYPPRGGTYTQHLEKVSPKGLRVRVAPRGLFRAYGVTVAAIRLDRIGSNPVGMRFPLCPPFLLAHSNRS